MVRAGVGVVHLDEDILHALRKRFPYEQRKHTAADPSVLQMRPYAETVNGGLAVLDPKGADRDRLAIQPEEILPARM